MAKIAESLRETLIDAEGVEKGYWQDLWRYRGLMMAMASRDISVRYKQTVLGVLWVIIKPLVGMFLFAFVFGRVAHLPSQGVPYPLFVMAAMLPWQLFSGTITDGSMSLVNQAGVISKVYFPRMILPISSVLVNLFDWIVTLPILGVIMVWYRTPLSAEVLLLPLELLPLLIIGFGGVLWLSAVSVRYRDFRYIVPFLIQFGLYATPVGYSVEAVPEHLRRFFELNPLTPILEYTRACTLGLPLPSEWSGLLLACLVAFVFLGSGIWYFRSVERDFADVI